MMETLSTDEARGGTASRRHRVLAVLIVSLVFLAADWYVVETIF
ncbi:MAG: hypothetical protein ACR2PF_12425 [Rhizobiaceae bacterium]